MTIKAETVYTKALLRQFARFSLARKPGQVVFYILFELLVLTAACSSIFAAPGRGTADAADLVFWCIIALLLPAVLLLAPALAPKTGKKVLGAANSYTFTDSGFEVSSTQTGANGTTRADYSYLNAVYETRDCFYLFISRRQALLLRREDFTEGTAEELAALLKARLPAKKYHVKKR